TARAAVAISAPTTPAAISARPARARRGSAPRQWRVAANAATWTTKFHSERGRTSGAGRAEMAGGQAHLIASARTFLQVLGWRLVAATAGLVLLGLPAQAAPKAGE